jgi:Concanavalin A-like lectin/glucanases superfamily
MQSENCHFTLTKELGLFEILTKLRIPPVNTINFNCPECHQSLEVDAGHAGTAVACPACGQTVLVPPLARLAEPPSFPEPASFSETPSFPETRARVKGWLLAVLAMVVLSLLVLGLLLWHGRPGTASLPAVPYNLAGNLVLYFNFSKPSADHVPDLSGHGNNGEAVNVQWVADRQRGGCLQFGLTNSYLRVPDNDSLNPANVTMAAWIKTSFTDRFWRRVFDKAYGKEFDLTMAGDNAVGGPNDGKSWRGQVALEVVHQWAPSGINVADDQWHQVVGTFDGSELRLYIDGQPIGSPHRAKGQPKHTSYDLTIGANRSTGVPGEMGQSFNGLMDDVMMFNRALSPDEIQALYNSQKSVSSE